MTKIIQMPNKKNLTKLKLNLMFNHLIDLLLAVEFWFPKQQKRSRLNRLFQEVIIKQLQQALDLIAKEVKLSHRKEADKSKEYHNSTTQLKQLQLQNSLVKLEICTNHFQGVRLEINLNQDQKLLFQTGLKIMKKILSILFGKDPISYSLL